MSSPIKLIALATLLMMAGPAAAQQASNCTRATIVAAISANPQWTTVTSAISALNATFLLPNEARNGTLFLPVNSAFAALNVSTATLLSNYSGQLLSILAYHSLLNQNKTFNRAGLLAASPLQTDLGALVAAGAGRNVSLPVSVTPSVKHKAGTTGLELVSGRVANDSGRLRGVVRTCGLIIYESDVVLLPAALADVPDGLAYFGGTVPANIDSATSPGGLAAAIASGNLKVASVPYNGTTDAGDVDAEGSTVGSSNTTRAGATTLVAGQALSLNGTGGTLSSTFPVLLLGTITNPAGGNSTSAGNSSAPALGPGLIYLNGTIQDGVGVNGTATLVRSLSRNGAVLSRATIPLMGAMVNGTAFDAAGTTIRAAMGTTNGTRQANSTTGTSTVSDMDGFGSALTQNGNGTFNATAGMLVLLDGSVTNGTAVNATGATGSAAMGNLGPGAILINGTVTDGQGVSGTAYPVVAATPLGILVNLDNAVNITGASLSGLAFNATGLTTRQQAATAAGGAGAASAGSPGVPPSGNSTTGSNATTGAGAATAAVAGQALSLNGTGGTLSTTSPVLLLGSVTLSTGASNGTSGDNDTDTGKNTTAGNSTATALGPGLIYLNGTVQDGVGVNGTATLVRSLNKNGAVLTRASIPLMGATVNGTAFDAAGTTIRAATGTANGTQQANSTTGGISTVAAVAGFGSALTTNADGTFNATAGMPVLLDGNVTGGAAVNATGATGSAAMGNLGPGAILVNGTVTNGQGVSGTAYPVVAATSKAIIVNRDNAVNITGASLSGTAFNATGITTRQQSATAAGGAGAASSGSPGVPPAGGSTASAPSGSGSSSGSAAPAPAPQSAPTTSSAAVLPMAALAAASLLLTVV